MTKSCSRIKFLILILNWLILYSILPRIPEYSSETTYLGNRRKTSLIQRDVTTEDSCSCNENDCEIVCSATSGSFNWSSLDVAYSEVIFDYN